MGGGGGGFGDADGVDNKVKVHGDVRLDSAFVLVRVLRSLFVLLRVEYPRRYFINFNL